MESSFGRSKFLFCVQALVLIAIMGSTVGAQGLPSALPSFGGAGFSEWVSTITSLPGLNRIQAGDLLIKPTVQLGYKKIGFNFNLDVPPTQLLSPFGVIFPEFGTLLDLFPLDAKIQSADLGVGTFRLEAQLTPACGLFASISANIPRTVGIRAIQGPNIWDAVTTRGVALDRIAVSVVRI